MQVNSTFFHQSSYHPTDKQNPLAFGLFASRLPNTPPYTTIKSGILGLHPADSITTDAHKLLNVPDDTGIFFTRHPTILTQVFSNTNAPYLSSDSQDGIISPLNLGIENSRRWRALPVYANLISYGRLGLQEMIVRMVELARGIAKFIATQCDGFLEVLFPEAHPHPSTSALQTSHSSDIERIFIITTFRARDRDANASLVKRINEHGRIYVSGTVIEGEPAARIAVGKWDVDVEGDLRVVRDVLRGMR